MRERESNSGGFTLIELLVVISIIGFLSSIVLVSLNTTRVKARNSRRLADVHQLVNAFNLGLSSSNSFPITGVDFSAVCIGSSCYDGWSIYTANGTVDAFFAPYISKPTDLVGGNRGFGGYLYINPWVGGPSGSGAYLWYALEPSGSCGSGVVVDSSANYILCVLKVD